VLFTLKPKRDQTLSSGGKMLYSRSAKELDRISFDPLSVGRDKI
jgi:hypothetical protein